MLLGALWGAPPAAVVEEVLRLAGVGLRLLGDVQRLRAGEAEGGLGEGDAFLERKCEKGKLWVPPPPPRLIP